jgi:uncharacterized membrane protein
LRTQLIAPHKPDVEHENWTVVPSTLVGLVSRYRRNHCRRGEDWDSWVGTTLVMIGNAAFYAWIFFLVIKARCRLSWKDRATFP